MKVQIVTQENFQWLKGYKKLFSNDELIITKTAFEKPSFSPDVKILMWCNEDAVKAINSHVYGQCELIVFVRRYEFFTPWIDQINWKNVHKVVFVNGFLADEFEKRTGVKHSVIYNSVCLDDWTFKERDHGRRIGIVGWVNQKKNLPLAMQILAELPSGYELHVAGGIQDPTTIVYLVEMAKTINRKIHFYGRIPHENMDKWMDDIDYILSCAISEGCPNNVLEAMAKGIKPIIHSWPGARFQFPEDLIFDSVSEAVNIIRSNYNSYRYKDIISNAFGDGNYDCFKKLIS